MKVFENPSSTLQQTLCSSLVQLQGDHMSRFGWDRPFFKPCTGCPNFFKGGIYPIYSWWLFQLAQANGTNARFCPEKKKQGVEQRGWAEMPAPRCGGKAELGGRQHSSMEGGTKVPAMGNSLLSEPSSSQGSSKQLPEGAPAGHQWWETALRGGEGEGASGEQLGVSCFVFWKYGHCVQLLLSSQWLLWDEPTAQMLNRVILESVRASLAQLIPFCGDQGSELFFKSRLGPWS